MSLPFPVWNTFPEFRFYFLVAFLFLELCGFRSALLNIVSCSRFKAFLVKPLHRFIMNSLFLELFADGFSNPMLKLCSQLRNLQKTCSLLVVVLYRNCVYIGKHCTLEHYHHYWLCLEYLHLSAVFPYTVNLRYKGKGKAIPVTGREGP
jgi:hypothetical protein